MQAHSNSGSLADENIKQYVDLLVAEKKFEVETEVLEQIKADLVKRLESIINTVILASLPKEKLEEFDVLLEKGAGEEVSKFCEENIPNLQEVVTNELINFRKAYLGLELS